MMDRWLGKFVQRAHELGVMENTLLVVLSDHGHCLGRHRPEVRRHHEKELLGHDQEDRIRRRRNGSSARVTAGVRRVENVLRVLLPLPRCGRDGRRNRAESAPFGELGGERHARGVHSDGHERTTRQGNAIVEGASHARADGRSLAIHQRSQLGPTRTGSPAHGVGIESVISTSTNV